MDRLPPLTHVLGRLLFYSILYAPGAMVLTWTLRSRFPKDSHLRLVRGSSAWSSLRWLWLCGGGAHVVR